MSAWGDKVRDLFRPHAGWVVLSAALALVAVGVCAIGTVPRRPNQPDMAIKQLQWLAIGVVVMGACLVPSSRRIARMSVPAMIAVLALLVAMVLPFMPTAIVPIRKGTRAWIDLQFMMFQPSELAKITFVLGLAWYLRHRDSYRTLRGLLVPFAIMFLPVALILRQPDMGTALLFPPVLFAMLVAAGARLKHMSTLAGLGLLVLALNIAAIYTLPESMQLLKGYQRDRIKALVDLSRDGGKYNDRTGYQQSKAMTIIGSGGTAGYGGDRSATILRFNSLPEAHNDMVFAVIVNRWGWIGGAGVLGLYVTLLGGMLVIASGSKDPFARLALVGFASVLLTQLTVNIGMNLGMLPIIGITLPFVSYGGSSLLAAFAMVGLSINFAIEKPAMLTRPSFEFDHADAVLE